MSEKYKGYIIARTQTGYRISCEDNPEIHCHMKNKRPAYQLVDYVQSKKIPRKVGIYYLTCLCRISSDEKYKSKIQELVATKKAKGNKQLYYNPTKKK